MFRLLKEINNDGNLSLFLTRHNVNSVIEDIKATKMPRVAIMFKKSDLPELSDSLKMIRREVMKKYQSLSFDEIDSFNNISGLLAAKTPEQLKNLRASVVTKYADV